MKKIFNILIFVIAIAIQSCNSNAQTANISITDFEKGITQADIQLLDVRTAAEYQSGHLANALQADWNMDEQFKDRTKALDKNKPLYVYCLSGGRSNAAMQWLKENGFATVYNMQGGINAWKQANKPVQGADNNVSQIGLEAYNASIPKDKTVLVDIGAECCPPCKKMKPIIDSLEAQKYTVIKIDGGTQTELCKQLNVAGFPVFIIYKNGIEVNRKQGLIAQAALIELMK
jgi:rhodanese-related sulfurtransferase